MTKFLISGLGNIGSKYLNTRHNIGFLFIDYLTSKFNFPVPRNEPKFNAEISIIKNDKNMYILCKPTSYMNLSGIPIRKIKDYYEVEIDNIFVIHDDLDIQFGDFKIQVSKGPKAHNGIISVEENLQNNNFLRVRIGIENRSQEMKGNITGMDYVLSKFTDEELITLEKTLFPRISDEFTKILGIN